MEEARFSTNWHMFNAENVTEQFTVRGETMDEFLTARTGLQAQMLAAGMGWTQQAKAEKIAGAYETAPIIGYIVGEVQSGKSKGQPKLFLYDSTNRPYSSYMMFREDAHLFPSKWPEQSEYDGASPPKKEDALNHRKFHRLEWNVPIKPQVDKNTGEVVKNSGGYIQYQINREATLDGAPAASPNVGNTKQGKAPAYITSVVTAYAHKREVPIVAQYDATQCASIMTGEDSNNDWWAHLAPAQQDAIAYARSFVRTYPVARADSNDKGVELLETAIPIVTKVVNDMAAELGARPLPKTTVLTYASFLLCDMVPEMPDDGNNPWPIMLASIPLGVVKWLVECASATTNGKPNSKQDLLWLKSFAEITLRIIAAEGNAQATDDEDIPF